MSLLKVNEVQNYNGSSLTLTASTVSTSAQLNTGGNISVTGSINVSDDSTTRSNLGLGSIATQASDNVTITGGNISNATLASTNRGGFFLIDEQTVTAQATVTYSLPSTTNVFYFIIYTSFYSSATDNVNLVIRNSSNTAFTCDFAGTRHWSDGSSQVNLNNSGATANLLSTVYNDSSKPSYAKIELHYGSASTAPHYEITAHQINGSAYSFFDHKAGYSNSSGVVDNIQFDVASSATITGSFKVFGVKI